MKTLTITEREDWKRELTIKKVEAVNDCYHVRFTATYPNEPDKVGNNYYEMFLTAKEIAKIKAFL